jgi:hypothetical protein
MAIQMPGPLLFFLRPGDSGPQAIAGLFFPPPGVSIKNREEIGKKSVSDQFSMTTPA